MGLLALPAAAAAPGASISPSPLNHQLMVHIGANQSEVCRALQQFSDDLRQHLTAQNFMEVNVQVSSEGQSQQQQSGHQQEEVSAALQLDDAPQFQQNESVLIKV